MRHRRLILMALTMSLGLWAGALSAHAELGGKAATIAQDRIVMRAKQATTTKTNYSVHTLTLENGTVTHEFTTSDGLVFAVSWDGPSRPDLRQLFGVYFPRFQEDNQRQKGEGRSYEGPKSSHIDFMARSFGKNGTFWGYAYLPSELPKDFDLNLLNP